MPRTRSRLTRAVAAGSTAALLTLAAACGGSGGSSSGSAGPSSSSSASSSSSGSSATPLTTSDIGQRLSTAQKKAGTFSFRLSGTAAGQRLQGTGKADISGSQIASDVTLEEAGQQIRAIAVDGVYYFQAAVFRTAKPWLKVDPKASSGLGAVLGQLGANADPSKLLGALGKASKVTRTGSAEVGGTSTTAYDVTLPSSALTSVLNYPETLVKELPRTLTFRVYVDGQDLVRRQSVSLTVRGASTTTTTTFDDYGEKVSISAPPAGQVTSKAPALGSTPS